METLTKGLSAFALCAVMLAVMLAGSTGSNGSTYAQEDPVAVVQALVEEFDASGPTGDGAAIAAHFTEGGSFITLEAEGSFGIFGRPAMEIAFSEEPDSEFSVTVAEIAADGDTVTGTVEFTDSNTVAAGIDRGLADFTAVVAGNLVASLEVIDDLSDPQTAQLAEYLASLPEDGEDEGPPPEKFAELEMTGDQTGEESHAFVGDFGDGVVAVFVQIEPGPEGVRQPSGIHDGTCDDLGGLAQQLAPVWNGSAGSFISADFHLLVDEPHAIAVAASPDDTSTVVACAGPIVLFQEPTVVLPETGTGTANGDGNAWPVVVLAVAGLAIIAATGALRLRRR